MQFSPRSVIHIPILTSQATIMNNSALKKTSSFPVKKSPPSMQFPRSIPYLPGTASLIEFSTSPDRLALGQEVYHFGHPQHGFYKVDLPDRFTCSGCRDYGSGKRFTCRQCDFQLHEFCGKVPEQLKAHPLHMHHQLFFSSKPGEFYISGNQSFSMYAVTIAASWSLFLVSVKGGLYKAKCDVCGKSAKGYSFRCNACSYQMHPCCAMLSNEFTISVHPHPLRILPPAAAAMSVPNGDSTAPGFVCGECNRAKRSGRVYRCTVCDYHLHAACAKNMVNGLPANGIKKSGKLGTVARLASQVVLQFIGRLIEGIGESVGEALIQSDDRGRRPWTDTHTYLDWKYTCMDDN